ncbi:TIR domain-containing protein [Gemmatimonas sp.]|jgi:predicted nucleotide-binding protein|uniref:TIR domain-containing protein n=1 Tax=Gemmatimonas sp. TaxID=1962908 RepID=UPI0037BE9CA0
MDDVTIAFAKAAAILSSLRDFVKSPSARYFDPDKVAEYFPRANVQMDVLRRRLPQLYEDLPRREFPVPSPTTDHDGRGYIERPHLTRLIRDLEYVFEVRANSELAVPEPVTRPDRVFISHGRAPDWREVQSFLEKDLLLKTLELAQEASQGRTILQKLEEESARCSFAVVVMTGDDRDSDGNARARENVMHEIGYFQGRYGLSNVCLLHEEGTSIPSNIHGLVYIPFPRALVSAAFGTLARELKSAFST